MQHTPRPADWCYQCGATCREFFAGDQHLPPRPYTAEQDAAWWLVPLLSDTQAADPRWLDALARHVMARSLRAAREAATPAVEVPARTRIRHRPPTR